MAYAPLPSTSTVTTVSSGVSTGRLPKACVFIVRNGEGEQVTSQKETLSNDQPRLSRDGESVPAAPGPVMLKLRGRIRLLNSMGDEAPEPVREKPWSAVNALRVFENATAQAESVAKGAPIHVELPTPPPPRRRARWRHAPRWKEISLSPPRSQLVDPNPVPQTHIDQEMYAYDDFLARRKPSFWGRFTSRVRSLSTSE